MMSRVENYFHFTIDFFRDGKLKAIEQESRISFSYQSYRSIQEVASALIAFPFNLSRCDPRNDELS